MVTADMLLLQSALQAGSYWALVRQAAARKLPDSNEPYLRREHHAHILPAIK